MQVTPITLTGQWVRLEPLSERHIPALLAAAQIEEIWQWMPVAMPGNLEAMRGVVESALEKQERGEQLPFAIIEKASDKAIGSTRYLDISPHDRHVEIGWTWLGRDYWRTAVNTECKYLLLRHAFESLGCIRVQLKTDLRNVRSQRAIERLGAVREGILRKAAMVRGYQRWSVYYSILDDEWPVVRERLEIFLNIRPDLQAGG